LFLSSDPWIFQIKNSVHEWEKSDLIVQFCFLFFLFFCFVLFFVFFQQEPTYVKKKPRTPQTPPGTPPRSPTLTFTTAAADTTHKGVTSHSPDPTSHYPDGKQKMKEAFRIKVCQRVNGCRPSFLYHP